MRNNPYPFHQDECEHGVRKLVVCSECSQKAARESRSPIARNLSLVPTTPQEREEAFMRSIDA